MDCTRQQLREEWLQALERNEFSQAGSCLHRLKGDTDKDQYCCLGVACVIAARHGVTVVRDSCGVIAGATLTSQAYVKKAFGFASDNGGEVPEGGELPYLTDLNDSGHDFPYIAAKVRAHPELIWEDKK